MLFTIGKTLIGLYIGSSKVASSYGAAGALIIVLLWIYYSAQIFLLGAEFTRLYAEERGSRSRVLPPVPRAIVVQPAANTPLAQRALPAKSLVKLGAALALGVGASIGLNFWRRR